MSYIQLNNLNKTYGNDETKVHALQSTSLNIEKSEFVSIMGESGSGKSTMLSLLGAMSNPSNGNIHIDDIDIYSLNNDQKADFRREYLGFVFQSFYLVPYLSVIENVMLPLVTINDYSKNEKEKMAKEILGSVGLAGKESRLPSEISGGERERTAIARAIVNKPTILLADEPTGNLDSKISEDIMKLIQSLNQQGMTIIMVTHSELCSNYAKRKIILSDGKIVADKNLKNKEPIQV